MAVTKKGIKAAPGAIHIKTDVDQAIFTGLVSSKTPMMVDFYADWCGPCKMAAPVIEKLAVEFDGRVKVLKVDVDAMHDLALKYGVMSIPTVVTIIGDTEVAREIGFVGEARYKEMLEEVEKKAAQK